MTMKSWLLVASRPQVMQRSAKVAIVVGTILGVINHSDKMLAGNVDVITALKLGFTYLVPFSVSIWASVQAIITAESII
jgi:hypothetical protein